MGSVENGAAKTYVEIPWVSGHISIGSGYDVMARELRPEALEKFEVVPEKTGGRKHTPKFYSLETQEELDAQIQNSVKASAPIDGVQVEVSAEYLHGMKISSSEMVTIIQEIIEDPPHKPATKVKLSDEALALLRGPGGAKAFFAKYGEYFVYGSMNRSTFLAACQFKADTKETLDTFKASMNIGVKDVAEAGRTLEASLKTVHGKVSTKIHCEVFGYSGTGEPVFTTTEIKSPYEKFQKNFKPSPYVALLQHYSSLDERIPLPGREVISKSIELTEAYQRIFMLQGRVVSLSMKRAEDLASAINRLYESLKKISIDDKNWKDKLTTWSNEVMVYQNEYQKWVLRSKLIEDAKKMNQPQLQTGVDFASGPQNQWARGIMLDSNHAVYGKIASDVEKREDAHWTVDYVLFKSQDQRYTVSRHDRIIIGFIVQSHWQDGSNGWWKLHSGGVNTSEMTVEFITKGSRGANWSLYTWTVDKALYERSY